MAYTDATNQSGSAKVAFSDYERASKSNATKDWNLFFRDVTSGSLRVGISDPNADPAGYRGWIVLEAAGSTYANDSSFFTKRMLSNAGNVTGSSAANLIAPLQAGQIQFLLIYKSAAISHALNYLALPDSTNLGDQTRGSYYSRFTYALKTSVQKGAPIVLYITVPRGSTEYIDAVQFTVYTVTNAPILLKSYGLSVFSKPKLYNSTAVPGPIGQLVMSGFISYGGTL
jgi:molybdate/tungstate transport system substrate-binding protein